jgi:alanine racemase
MEIKINHSAVCENIEIIQKFTNKAVITVVKNNAYNIGLQQVCEEVVKTNSKTVALLELRDAIFLRGLFPELAILLMNPATNISEITLARQHDIMLIIPSFKWLAEYGKTLQGISLHLKVDVGMNRFGVTTVDETLQVLDFCRNGDLNLVGLYTHFPMAEVATDSLHDCQVTKFVNLYEQIKDLWSFTYIHAENSRTIANNDKRLAFCTHVRPGVFVYGYNPYPIQLAFILMPTVFIYASVIAKQQLPANSWLGYGKTYQTETAVEVAILSIGYGDGIMKERLLNFPVTINNQPYQCVRVLMSHAFILSDENVNVGDIVEIYGEHLQIGEFAASIDIPASQQLAMLHLSSR